MAIDDFIQVIQSLAQDLRLPIPTQTGTQFQLTTRTNLNLAIDWIAPDSLLISFTQTCLGKDSTDFLWNVLQANLISDQSPAIVTSGSYTESLIICWMKIGLLDYNRHAVLSHVERFVGHVETLNRWVNAFKIPTTTHKPIIQSTFRSPNENRK